jgi:Zn-dependent M28 family amino/carboxypeptidase
MKKITFIGSLLLTGIILFQFSCKAPKPNVEQALQSIQANDIKKHDSILASDAFMGRKPFTQGETKTIHYLKDAFKKMGLKPANHGSYFQKVPMVELKCTPSEQMKIVTKNGSLAFQYLDDYVATTRWMVDKIDLKNSPMVFVGYGIVAPEYHWNDYKDLDVKGKTVVVLVNDPGYVLRDSTFFKGKTMTYYGRWTYKYEEAARQGATGVIVIHETGAAGYPWSVLRNGSQNASLLLRAKDKNKSRCAFEAWLTTDAARKLFAKAGFNYDKLAKAALKPDFKAVPIDASVSLTLKNKLRYDTSHNVLAMLPGSERSDECVIYTAHWDHFGIGPKINGDSIYNGGDDNGYPLACLLETAKAFSKLNFKPKRTVIFMAITAEEEGLLGSEYYVTHPVFPLNKTLANINYELFIPMGKMKDVTITGYGQSQLDDYVKELAKKQGRYVVEEPHPENGMYFRSDHFSFAKYGVPSLFCKGWTESAEHGKAWTAAKVNDYWKHHYHQPSDEYHSSDDVAGLVQDTKLFFRLGLKLAQQNDFPNWKSGSEFKARRDKMMQEK